VDGATRFPYAIPNLQVEWVNADIGIPVGFWRSVGHPHNAFAVECFLDELAEAAGADPLEFRLRLLRDAPRHRAVLELVAERAGWGRSLTSGRGLGLALHESFGSIVAQVAEVSVSGEEISVHRVVCAVDCGRVTDPDGVAAQMEGGVLFGLSAALGEAVTFGDGRVRERNFADYRLLRLGEAPEVGVHIVPSDQKPGGVGEPGVPPVAPAVANAIRAATGRRVRELPLRRAFSG
jgi:CO/xanthine dehydrogenase Mo-binding subunit